MISARFTTLLVTAVALLPAAAEARTLEVGVGKAYTTIAAAVSAAAEGDVVEIFSGTYTDDTAVVRANNLTIRGVGATRPRLEGTSPIANGKGLLVIAAGVGPVTIEGLEFSGAQVADHNGAGIRAQGTELLVRDCAFHHNENGILAGATGACRITVEKSEFGYNGYGDGKTHNIYVSTCEELVFRGNYSHHAKVGHLLKSRAKLNYVLYNRLMDEDDGTSSYVVDLPQGGRSYIVGNLLQQGPLTSNRSAIISYNAEVPENPLLELFVVNNTIVNDHSASTTFVRVTKASEVVLRNNLTVGDGAFVAFPNGQGSATLVDEANLQPADAMLANRSAFDYHLLAGSPALDVGVAPGSGFGFDLTPAFQYEHVAALVARVSAREIDVGAYELEGEASDGGAQPPPDGGSKDGGLDLAPIQDGATTDSSAGDAAPSKSSDGGCAVGGSSVPGSSLLFSLLLAALLLVRRRA